MSLLDKASLIVTSNAYKESKLYSVVPNTTLGDMDVVRATTATRVNASGLIESVAVNVPRIDYTNGSCPSILVEPQRTNLVFPSATLTTQTRTVTAAPNTLSFYGTGTIVLSGVHIATLTGTGANNRVSLTFTPTAGSLILTVTGTVTNAQLELGSYATSYIPTVASTVTRNADVISKTGISSLIGQTEGTIFFDGIVNNIQNSSSNILNTNKTPSTSSQIALTKLRATNKIRFEQFFGAGTFDNILLQSTNTFSNGIRTKIAVRYKSGDFAMYINGNLEATSSLTFTNIGTKSELFLNDSTTLYAFQESVSFNSAQIYKTPLTNAELAQLTTL
jgi:hypothetical protein